MTADRVIGGQRAPLAAVHGRDSAFLFLKSMMHGTENRRRRRLLRLSCAGPFRSAAESGDKIYTKHVLETGVFWRRFSAAISRPCVVGLSANTRRATDRQTDASYGIASHKATDIQHSSITAASRAVKGRNDGRAEPVVQLISRTVTRLWRPAARRFGDVNCRQCSGASRLELHALPTNSASTTV